MPPDMARMPLIIFFIVYAAIFCALLVWIAWLKRRNALRHAAIGHLLKKISEHWLPRSVAKVWIVLALLAGMSFFVPVFLLIVLAPGALFTILFAADEIQKTTVTDNPLLIARTKTEGE